MPYQLLGPSRDVSHLVDWHPRARDAACAVRVGHGSHHFLLPAYPICRGDQERHQSRRYKPLKMCLLAQPSLLHDECLASIILRRIGSTQLPEVDFLLE